MTRTELNGFQKVLNAKQAEITGVLHRREGIAIERTADALDEVQLAAQREFKTRSLERETALLHDVRAALGRVADGSFGTCIDCEEEISSKRLRAVPWAILCIACQERSDRNESRVAYHGRILREAA